MKAGTHFDHPRALQLSVARNWTDYFEVLYEETSPPGDTAAAIRAIRWYQLKESIQFLRLANNFHFFTICAAHSGSVVYEAAEYCLSNSGTLGDRKKEDIEKMQFIRKTPQGRSLERKLWAIFLSWKYLPGAEIRRWNTLLPARHTTDHFFQYLTDEYIGSLSQLMTLFGAGRNFKVHLNYPQFSCSLSTKLFCWLFSSDENNYTQRFCESKQKLALQSVGLLLTAKWFWKRFTIYSPNY